jgi:hypothetical protein
MQLALYAMRPRRLRQRYPLLGYLTEPKRGNLLETDVTSYVGMFLLHQEEEYSKKNSRDVIERSRN